MCQAVSSGDREFLESTIKEYDSDNEAEFQQAMNVMAISFYASSTFFCSCSTPLTPSQSYLQYSPSRSSLAWMDALSSSNDSAVGPDDIHYQMMLKHLPSEVLNTLLIILNDIWLTGNFRSSWRQSSYVVPIPKPGKDTSDPTNYRPIALTSCVCKVMERMVNNRLVWYLERNIIITPTQRGFRKGRSTTHQLVRLESFVRDAFIQKQHATAIFFDLEKAYDTTWKFGILKDLHDTGLRGRLPLFIAGFLSDRKFQVRVGGSYSKLCEQGSILSVTLFCLKINSIIKAVCPGVDYSLYVDDFLICYRSKHIHIIEKHLQRSLNKLQEWADTNGFKFSTAKTVCVHFCHLRTFHSDPQLLKFGWICCRSYGVMGVLIWGFWLIQIFSGARTCSTSSMTMPSLVGLRFHPPPGWPKTLSILSVCLSVTLLNVSDCAPDFAMKALEHRNVFDAAG